MISSRKSAEVLAKFVFLVARSADVGFCSFADVLADSVVKRYLNSILKPIQSECKGSSGDCGWFQTGAPFAEANWDWTDDGFIMKGTCL